MYRQLPSEAAKTMKGRPIRILPYAIPVCCVSWLLLTSNLSNSGVVDAQEAWGSYGLGAQGCGTYIEQRRRPNRSYDDLVGSWFSGFISAYNYYGPKPQVGRDVNQDTVLAYLDKYCRDAPLASVAAGALELVKAYAK